MRWWPSLKRKPVEDDEEKLSEGTLISHLLELRQRILKALISIAVVFVCLLPFRSEIFTVLSRPVREQLSEGASLIATGVASPFLIPLKATLYVAIFIAMPLVLHQVWQFVAPGLYRSERRLAAPLLISSILLFYLGVAFAYLLVMELAFGFFISVTPENVMATPDISLYLSFALGVILAFGIAFQVPIATFVLVWSGLVKLETLRETRSYAFLSAFVIGMFLTPAEPLSQILMAVPMYLLYECGLFLCRIFLPEQRIEVENH